MPRFLTVSFIYIALGASSAPGVAAGAASAAAAAAALRGSSASSSALGGLALLDELETALGGGLRGAAERRAGEFEDAMRPIFASLPKTADGRLPWAGVRYLLHRIFVERHAWYVSGISDDGQGWSSASPSIAFAENVNDETAAVFERRLSGSGLSLHESAVFAATLESLVHEEAVDRLKAAYRAAGIGARAADTASDQEVEVVLDYYMALYVRKVNHTLATPKQVREITDEYDAPNWPATRRWVREVREEVVSTSPEAATSFAMTAKVVEEAMGRYGRWQTFECDAMKTDLVELERRGTGRVPLDAFYRAALAGKYLFTETKDYLRELGALDETDPSRPSVIIPNYLLAPSNCLAGSKFFSVCCLNECEALMKPLEEHIGAPEAEPSVLLGLLERLPSPTVEAPRRLPASVASRLDDIAAHHGGRVPLHGRLFAQLMHHAFPRECPYPHLAGTTAPRRGSQWSEETGEDFLANASAMQRHIEECSWDQESSEGSSSARRHSDDEDDDDDEDVGMLLHWSVQEELQVHDPVQQGFRASLLGSLRSLMLLAAAVSMAGGMALTARRSTQQLQSLPLNKKNFV